jgi:hypothetical protein
VTEPAVTEKIRLDLVRDFPPNDVWHYGSINCLYRGPQLMHALIDVFGRHQITVLQSDFDDFDDKNTSGPLAGVLRCIDRAKWDRDSKKAIAVVKKLGKAASAIKIALSKAVGNGDCAISAMNEYDEPPSPYGLYHNRKCNNISDFNNSIDWFIYRCDNSIEKRGQKRRGPREKKIYKEFVDIVSKFYSARMGKKGVIVDGEPEGPFVVLLCDLEAVLPVEMRPHGRLVGPRAKRLTKPNSADAEEIVSRDALIGI